MVINAGVFPFLASFRNAEHHAGNLVGADRGTAIDGWCVNERTSHEQTSDLLHEVSETETDGKSIDDGIFLLEIDGWDG